VIVHPGAIEEALSSEEAGRHLPEAALPDVLLPSKTLTPAERLGVYHGMYLVRMEEALAADYPGLKHFLGDDGFGTLVRDYVGEHPSRGYSLNPLGHRLPEFVARAATRVKSRGFAHDLASLEQAMALAFDAEETPRVSEAAITAVPDHAWEGACLQPVAAFSLLALRYPVNDYLQTVLDDVHDHPRPRRQDTFVAVYRRDYAVYRLGLTRPAHDLLADLAGGRPLGESIARVLQAGGHSTPSEHELFRWFRDWVSVGIFSKIVLADAPRPR
jgi:hypothetical protein